MCVLFTDTNPVNKLFLREAAPTIFPHSFRAQNNPNPRFMPSVGATQNPNISESRITAHFPVMAQMMQLQNQAGRFPG